MARLAIVGNGEFLTSGNLSIPFVRLSFYYISPSLIDPTGLTLQVVCSPACHSPFAKNLDSTTPTVNLTYADNTIPHWLATDGGGSWTGFTAMAMNPDGRVVGGATPGERYPETTVASGAVLTVTSPIPGYASEPAVAVVITLAGHPGSAEVWLI